MSTATAPTTSVSGDWYGVPHIATHCRKGRPGGILDSPKCACAFCRRLHGKPVQGAFGFITDDPEWQP